MLNAVPEVLSANASAVDPRARAVITRAIAAAPFLGGPPPRGLQVVHGAFELWADVRHWPRTTRAGHRGLPLAGGAALFNLRLAVAALGRRPVTTLLPFAERTEVLAIVRMAEEAPPPLGWRGLYRVLTDAGARRVPSEGPVPRAARLGLCRAAELEGSWLTLVDPEAVDDRTRAFIERGCIEWMDLAVAASDRPYWSPSCRRRPSDQTGTDPCRDVLAVLSSFHDLPVGQLRAGEAMQRVALTAAGYGLRTMFSPASLASAQHRAELARRIGHDLHPQIVLRIAAPTG